MVRLTRTVRFAINPSDNGAADSPNGYAGSPSMVGTGAHYELQVECIGEVDGVSSYLLDIKAIDKAVRSKVIPIIDRLRRERADASVQEVMAAFVPGLAAELGGKVESVRWMLSPYYSVEMSTNVANPRTSATGNPQPALGSVALLRQRFDFAAAHRLHVPGLSDDQNRALFGKCNYPGGHGHNYQFEPCVEVKVGGGKPGFTLQDLERLSQKTIIEPFDHRHLNQTDAFCVERGGLNPTVENIARVFFELLSKAIQGEARLRSVTVWETDRTSATYPAT
jgi:6-pyruvoyltetrahydropterin/6-carboxytetrahydropterin synthase